MLWNLIYDFFAQYIFGGYTNNGDFYEAYIWFVDYAGDETQSNTFMFNALDVGNYKMPFSTWLCTISTIITMVAILLFCVFIVKKIIGIIFRLFTGSSAF